VLVVEDEDRLLFLLLLDSVKECRIFDFFTLDGFDDLA